MYCDVYLLRRQGVKLSKDDVSASKTNGWLCYATLGPLAPPDRHAFLLKDHNGRVGFDEVLPRLLNARLRAISGGILLQGSVQPGFTGPYYRQAWWVVPTGQAKEEPAP